VCRKAADTRADSVNPRKYKCILIINSLCHSLFQMAFLEELTAIQLAQLTLSQDVFSSVADIERIFDRLTELPALHELAAYWDELNSALEEVTADTFLMELSGEGL